MKDIRESDWKRLRDLKSVALERFCDRALSEIERARSNVTATSHQRYLAIYDLIQERDKELARIFDDLKRSNAMIKLFSMYRAGLLTEDEMAGFSEEVRNVIAQIQNV